jgi:hypothetical protein
VILEMLAMAEAQATAEAMAAAEETAEAVAMAVVEANRSSSTWSAMAFT